MATKVDAELSEGVEAEDDQNSQEVVPLILQNTGFSLSKALNID